MKIPCTCDDSRHLCSVLQRYFLNRNTENSAESNYQLESQLSERIYVHENGKSMTYDNIENYIQVFQSLSSRVEIVCYRR